MRIPPALAAEWRREPEWLDDLPRLAAECAAAWDLELEEPYDTPRSLVVPAGAAVLKLNAPSHFEADHEADALACWDGRAPCACSRVTTNAARSSSSAACPARSSPRRTPTRSRSWRGSWSDSPARRRRTSLPAGRGEAERWLEEVPRRWEHGGRPFERSLLDAAIEVFRSVDRGASRLVNQDLHAWNVLRSEREPWLVIDPKPLVGEREVDGVGPLRNAGFSGDTAVVGRWLDALADLGMDRDRLRGWGIAHALTWGFDHGRWSTRSIEAARTISRA